MKRYQVRGYRLLPLGCAEICLYMHNEIHVVFDILASLIPPSFTFVFHTIQTSIKVTKSNSFEMKKVYLDHPNDKRV